MHHKSIFKSPLKLFSSSKSTNDAESSQDVSLSLNLSSSVSIGHGGSSLFWMERIKHQGKSPFNSDPAGYKIFRNVKVCSFCDRRLSCK